jgi:CheY-like chemotaxis protein
VNGDATQLEQILLNLGANAEHAMRSGKGQLEVTLHSVELDPRFIQSHPQLHPGLFARLTMRDTGTGIAQDILPKIFDPFFTTKEVNEGTGLGLSVVHGIVIAHGGAITVDSKLEDGTTFTLYLPQISQPIEEGELGFREMPRSVLTGKILVVDDEEPLARLTQELLRTFGFEVMAFTDPAKALEAFRADPENFAVVMTDQVMPGTTGKEVIRELLAIRPNLPIILCTGYGHAMNVEEPRPVGVTAFLLKPFLKDDLLFALHRVLNPEKEVGT